MQALNTLLGTEGAEITAVGQRVVHGGTKYGESVRTAHGVKARLNRLSALAPLHNPVALEAIEAVEAALPGVPQVAVFDTAFYVFPFPSSHDVYPLPYAWYTNWGVRRFGFDGISHAYCAERAGALCPPIQSKENVTSVDSVWSPVTLVMAVPSPAHATV